MSGKISIDDLIKKTIQEEGLDIPPSGFSDKVMHSIRESEQPDIYRPLIPKYALVAISGAIALLFIFFLRSGTPAESVPPYLKYIIARISASSMPASLSYSIWAALIILVIQSVLIGKLYTKMYR